MSYLYATALVAELSQLGQLGGRGTRMTVAVGGAGRWRHPDPAAAASAVRRLDPSSAWPLTAPGSARWWHDGLSGPAVEIAVYPGVIKLAAHTLQGLSATAPATWNTGGWP